MKQEENAAPDKIQIKANLIYLDYRNVRPVRGSCLRPQTSRSHEK